MIPFKDFITGEDARVLVLEGVRKLAKLVVATMGPKGRNILIERGDRRPMATKDGVTVAQEVFLEDRFENMGAQIVKEAAVRTNDAAGDGTTTATLLALSIMEAGLRHVSAGKNAISVKRGIDYAVAKVCAYLETLQRPVDNREEYKAIATISAQDEAVGDMIATMIEEVGPDGVITVETGSGFGLEKEHVEGMQFDSGYPSPYFVTDPARMECVLDDVPILLTDMRITGIHSILPFLDSLGQAKHKKLLIIAESVEGDALATLVVNKMKGIFLGVPVRAPAFGKRRLDVLMDLAALTGGTVISEELGRKLDSVKFDDLGHARRVTVGKHTTVIVGGAGTQEAIDTRIGEIKQQITVADKEFDKTKLHERLAKLSGGVGIIKVGAATEFEQKELQHRVEDALSATKAAVEEGIVPGGGVAYLRAKQELEASVLKELKTEEERLGAQIVFDALPSCFLAIVENAGFPQEDTLEKVLGGTGAFGFNAATGEYCDLLEARIINPKKVERCALQNAASVAGMFLTLEGAIADAPQREQKE